MTVRRSFGFPLSIAVRSHVGRVRTNNEDSFGHAWLDDGSLFVIVADGMGGHEAGEVASGLAVRVVEEVIARDVEGDPRERLYHGLLEANEAILDEGRASGTRGMGTTAIAGVLRGSDVFIGQVGDSRLYHVRKGHPSWRTLDHTRVQMLLDQGSITEEEARDHPEAGMLTRALGHSRMADGRTLVPDVLEEPLEIEEHDAVVLCSDGLHDLVDDWEIAQIVAGNTPDVAVDQLIELAIERGGHDNVTVAVIVAGERAEEYDPAYNPVEASPEDEDLLQAEVTFDDLHSADEAGYEPTEPCLDDEMPTETALPSLVPPADSPPPPNRNMMFGMAAVGVVGGLVLIGVLAAVAASAYWFMG